MAALQPLSEGHPAPPPQAQRSFLDALSGKSSEPFNPKTPRLFRGKPHVHFDAADIDRYSQPFNHALIGKFSNGRPSMDRIRKSFVAIGFSGQYTIGLIDYRHLIIRFNHEDDYIRCFLKRTWSIDGFVMRVLKWHYKFSVDTECSIVPVWVKFPLLPLHLYNKEALYSIARLVGEPLKLDASTSSFNRPSVARVCVEIDLLKERVTEVWITQIDFGFWQTVEYDDLPSYCRSCNKVGHVSDICRKNSTSTDAAQPKKKEAQMPVAPSRLQWQIKASITAPQHAVAPSAAADPNPTPRGQDDLPPTYAASSVIHANLCTNVAAASNAPLPVITATIPPTAHQIQDTHALAADSVAACSAPIPADFSASAAECTPPLHSKSPTLVATAELLPPTSEATHMPRAVPPLKQPQPQLPQLPASSSASSSLAKEAPKSYVDILLGAQQSGTASSVSIKPRFHAIKSAEFPSLPLPNFKIFFAARPLFPQDSLEAPSSPHPVVSYHMYSEGDDVPRQPTQRKKLSFSLRASSQDFNVKLNKGRRPEFYPVIRKKWKKLAPYSHTEPTSTSNTSPNNATDSNEHPTANPHEEDPGDDSPIEYESNWHSSTSDDEADINYENLLGFEEKYLPIDYQDFSFALPLQTRRKYNKRFRDLPSPLPTRSSRQH